MSLFASTSIIFLPAGSAAAVSDLTAATAVGAVGQAIPEESHEAAAESFQLLKGGFLSSLRSSTPNAAKAPPGPLRRIWEKLALKPSPPSDDDDIEARDYLDIQTEGGIAFYDLEALAGLISSGLRADSDRSYRVGMDRRIAKLLDDPLGLIQLYLDLKEKGVRIRPLRLAEDIYQTDDPRRSIVELVSNAIDASREDVAVRLGDGFYQVADRGTGMDARTVIQKLLIPKLTTKQDAAKQIGRFGIGFYTALRHLKGEGDRLEVLTHSGRSALHLHFVVRAGRIKLGVKEESKAGKGTTVRLRAGDLREEALLLELETYLRYVNDGRVLSVNGEKFSRGEALQVVPDLNRPGDLGSVYRAAYPQDRVTVKAGELIVESYSVEGGGGLGDLVIALPHGTGLTITRDALVVDQPVYDYMAALIGRLERLEDLNSLVPLVQRLDQRHEREPLLNRLRERTEAVVASQYPEGLLFPANGIQEQLESPGLLVAPELFNPLWWERFSVPDEFRSGTYTAEGGWEMPIRILLLPGLKGPLWIDPEMGVLYLKAMLFESRADFVWSALWMIGGSEFQVRWGSLPARETLGGEPQPNVQPASAPKPAARLKGSEIEMIQAFWRERGYRLDQLAVLLPGGPFEYVRAVTAAGRVWFMVSNEEGKWGVLDGGGNSVLLPFENRSIDVHEAAGQVWFRVISQEFTSEVLDVHGNCPLSGKYHSVMIHEAAGRVWFMVQNQEGMCGVLDKEGNIVLPLEYHGIDVREAAGRVWFAVSNEERKRGVLDEEGNIVLPLENHYINVREAAGRVWFEVQNEKEKWGVWDAGGNSLFREYDFVGVGVDTARVWFVVKSQEGKWGVLDEQGNILLPLEYRDVFVREAAGRVWFMVQNQEGKSGVLDAERNIVVPLENSSVMVGEAAGQIWFAVLNEKEKWGVLDAEGNIVVPLEYHGIDVCEAAGRVWFRDYDLEEKWGALDAQGKIVLPIEQTYFDIEEHGGRAWAVSDRNSFLLDAVEPIKFEGLPAEHAGGLLLVKRDGHYIPLWFWEEVQGSEQWRDRLEQILSRRLDPVCLFYLRDASKEVWDWALQEQNRSLLGLLQTSEALGFVSRQYDSLEHSAMERALRLIKLLPRPRTLPLSIYLERLAELFQGGFDIAKALKILERRESSEETQALKLYLTQREVVGIGKGELGIPGGGSHRLANVITHLRLSEAGASLEDIQKTKHYDNEEDQRQLEQAVLHLHGIHPFLWVREFLQNALDALRMAEGTAADRQKEIRTETFLEEGRLHFRIRDEAGMSEEEFLGLLQPGESAKRETMGLRGRFGIGFKAALAGADRVRLKTAVRGTGEVILAQWEVERDRKGKIKEICLRTEKRANPDGFYGTVIETQRDSSFPLLEGAQIEARLRDMGQYIRAAEAKLWHNGEWINEKRNGPLAVLHHENLGVIELYDGLKNRILLGGLPLTELPAALWESVPEGIREYYRRLGFYLNLDHTRLVPTLTRDRLRDQETVFATLSRVLPGLLMHGFLQRVVGHQADLAHLPPEYFVEAYRLAERDVLDPAVLLDGRRINTGRMEEVEMERYAKGERGQRELLKLLTVVRFLPVTLAGGQTRLMSLRDIHQTYSKARLGDQEEGELLKQIRGLPLPRSILKRLEIADESAGLGKRVAGQWQEESVLTDHPILFNFGPDRFYSLDEVKDDKARAYLELVREVARTAGAPFGIEEVEIGIHTQKDHASAYACHFGEGGCYSLYRTYGPHLLKDIRDLAALRALAKKDPERAQREFSHYLARLYEQITHELTHVIEEKPEHPDFTHDRHFRNRQRQIMTAAPITAETFREWFSMISAMDY